MKMHHTPYHWIMVALVLAAFLLTLSVAYGQSGAAAAFEGRPAMAGAQGGQGAQAGPPQGGIGVQGSDAAQRNIRLRNPRGPENVPPPALREADPDAAAANADATTRKDVAPGRDQSLAKDQRSVAKTTKRAAKRTISRARHGVSEIDSSGRAAAP